MAAGDWYYQVWVHCEQETRVYLIETYKTEWQARKSADMRNAAVRHDTPPDLPARNFYFVRAVTEEQLLETAAEKFRHHHSEDMRQYLKQYDGAMKPYAKEMVDEMRFSILTCKGEVYWRLYEHGGRLEGYRRDVDGLGTITCSTLYTGRDIVRLEVAVVRGEKEDVSIVDSFRSESDLLAWLNNSLRAAAACEVRLIGMLCDRYRGLSDRYLLK